jgi:hypothetical protein
MGVYLSRDEILKADDLKVVDVDVPEWGGVVRVRALSGVERDQYEVSIIERAADGSYVDNFVNRRAKLAALSIIDENGARMFSADDVVALGNKSTSALSTVLAAINELSGIGNDADEDAEGNSEAAPSSEPGSPSPVS